MLQEVKLLLKFRASRNPTVVRVDPIDKMTFNWTPLHLAAVPSMTAYRRLFLSSAQ